jgi:protein-tyrosine phosphatase
MIELHSHILNGLDDGAADREESLGLLVEYARQGVSDIVCTPHCLPPLYGQKSESERFLAEIARQIADLQTQSQVRLHSGAELVLSNDLPAGLASLEPHALTLAGSAYLLVELPGWVSGGLRSLEPLLFKLQLAGYCPILAHPERIRPFEEARPILAHWVETERVFLQINTSSFVSQTDDHADQRDRYERRRDIVNDLLEHRLVHLVASDAHDTQRRPPQLADAQVQLSRQYGQDLADLLLKNNPAAVLADQPLTRP